MSHIMVWRGELPEDGVAGFWHHGIECLDRTIIHYSGMQGMKTLQDAQIQRTGRREFEGEEGRMVHTVHYAKGRVRFTASEICARAESRIGQGDYHLLYRNCETFVRWCVLGRENSCQVQGAVIGAFAAGASLVFGGGLLGASVAALVMQRAWDNGRNRSPHRSDGGSGMASAQQAERAKEASASSSYRADSGVVIEELDSDSD